MKKRKKRKLRKIYKVKEESKSTSILPILLVIALLSLFSEAMRTIPAGAKSEFFSGISYELPKLNSNLIEKKFLNKSLLIDKKFKYQESKNEVFLIEENFTIDNELIVANTSNSEIERIE